MLELNKIYQGDCFEVLKTFPDNSVDSIVTDPPYELGFMGKSWDKTGISNNKEMWAECLRVLKPGGHLLSFSGTRTYHRMASAIEDAGFEVRDMVEWVYGSGMSKGNVWNKGKKRTSERLNKENDLMVANGYEGWGNVGMKPSHEPIAFCRKPIEKGLTVAENCLKWGTGGINIDESRVGVGAKKWTEPKGGIWNKSVDNGATLEDNPLGRFPANLIHDGSDEVKECFPESKSAGEYKKDKLNTFEPENAMFPLGYQTNAYAGETGNASRFFKSIIYQAKASKSERNKGCEGLEEKPKVFNGQSDRPSTDMKDVEKRFTTLPKANNHPTVKPIALMEYLIKMVTPKGGIVLDPFAGSGSTLVAAKQNGFQYIGIELNEEYVKIIEERLK